MSTRDDLRQAVTTALRSRDRVALAALRSLQAALDDAEAVTVESPAGANSHDVAGGVAGLGVAEVARRELTDGEGAAVVDAEIEEHRAALSLLAGRGQDERVEQLQSELAVLERFRPHVR